MLATLLELVSTRIELVSVEIEEQIEYAAGILLWSVAAIFFGSLAVLLLALTIVIAFWDDHRLLAAGLVTGAFALIAIGAYSRRARAPAAPAAIPRVHRRGIQARCGCIRRRAAMSSRIEAYAARRSRLIARSERLRHSVQADAAGLAGRLRFADQVVAVSRSGIFKLVLGGAAALVAHGRAGRSGRPRFARRDALSAVAARAAPRVERSGPPGDVSPQP